VQVIRLTCFACGLSVPYRGSQADVCPRCWARRQQAVLLVPISDRPSQVSRHRSGRLRIETKDRDDRRVIVLNGELDIASAAILEEEIAEACGQRARDVVIDLTCVEFMDSMGLRAILRGKQLCEEHRCGYYLTPAQAATQDVFDATGVLDRLSFLDASA